MSSAVARADFIVSSGGEVARHVRPAHGLTGRNPCPGCGAEPALLCQAALTAKHLLEYDQAYFLVCWTCNLMLRVARGEAWRKTKLPRRC